MERGVGEVGIGGMCDRSLCGSAVGVAGKPSEGLPFNSILPPPLIYFSFLCPEEQSEETRNLKEQLLQKYTTEFWLSTFPSARVLQLTATSKHLSGEDITPVP